MASDPEILSRINDVAITTVGNSKIVFIAGQRAERASLDIADQTREALCFIDKLLAHVGARREHLVSARIHLISADDYSAIKAVWDAWLAPNRASLRAAVGTKAIQNAFKVEIDVTVAFTPEKRAP